VPDLLIATDSPALFSEVCAAVEEPGTSIRWARSGRAVLPALQQRIADLVITDLQIGSMGGLAVAMQATLEAAAGRLEKPVPMLMLLDRRADTFLAKRTAVAGWLVKPLDPLRISAAVTALLAGGRYYDRTLAPGVPDVLPA
jgi:two-component system, OmpR family, response regulator BaeR